MSIVKNPVDRLIVENTAFEYLFADILNSYSRLAYFDGLVRFTTDDWFKVIYKEGSFNWILEVGYKNSGRIF